MASMPPLVLSKNHRDSLPRAECYNCDTVNLMDGTSRQWCRSCHAPLAPAPAWVQALDWPEKPIPTRERRRMYRRASTPIKAVRFEGEDGRSLAGALEIITFRDRVRMNDLILGLLRSGLKQLQAERRAAEGT